MAFDYAEYQAFVQLLYKHPELRAEVRKLVLSDDILTLPQVVRELAEAQKRSEERLSGVEERVARLETAVAELAEAQKRTEQRVEELAEAQKRSEERLTRLETAVAELAEAQKRSEERLTRVEQRMDSLETEMKKTRSEVAGLAAAFGSTLEEEAASVVESVMRRKGYRLLDEATTLRFNGDVDVALPVETPEGQRLLVVVESKARLSRRDVIAWQQRVQSPGWQQRMAAAGYPGPYLAYCYAIRADAGARDAVQEAGLGLLKSDGEVIPPAGLVGA